MATKYAFDVRVGGRKFFGGNKLISAMAAANKLARRYGQTATVYNEWTGVLYTAKPGHKPR